MTASINVLQEILTWSKDRPNWQRDGLRRLVMNGELTEQYVRDLADICKGDYGLAKKKAVNALAAEEHVPAAASKAPAISLESIFHSKGVNALAIASWRGIAWRSLRVRNIPEMRALR